MDDASLCQLIREALHSPERAEALALAIYQLPEIKRYLDRSWMPYVYEAALRVTERDVQRNIKKFSQMYLGLNLEIVNCQNPSEAANVRKYFIRWVKMILNADCKDMKHRQYRQPPPVSTSAPSRREGSLTIEETIDDFTLSGIKLLLEGEYRSLARQMKCYIETDPEMRLRNCHPLNRPNVNCQILSQKLLLEQPPINRRQVARELDVPEQTVYSRWRKYCLPLLQTIAKELGYEN